MNQILYETPFDGATVDEMETALWRLFSQGKWPVDASALTEVVVELADNAILHSGEGEGWCSVQHGDRLRRQLTVVIADRGVGIPYRINQATEDLQLDDYQALLLAFQRRFSSTGDPHRGFGLNIVLDYTERVPGSVFSLESGHAVYAATDGRGRVLSKGGSQGAGRHGPTVNTAVGFW